MRAHWDFFYFPARPARLVPSFQTLRPTRCTVGIAGALAPHSDGAPRLHVRAILARLLRERAAEVPAFDRLALAPADSSPLPPGSTLQPRARTHLRCPPHRGRARVRFETKGRHLWGLEGKEWVDVRWWVWVDVGGWV